jgi:ankyrin repeat protein
MKAVVNDHKDIVELLLNNGADVNIKDNGGNTVLMRVAFIGYIDIIKLLLKHKDININEKDQVLPLIH